MQTKVKENKRMIQRDGLSFRKHVVQLKDWPPHEEVDACKGWLSRYAKKRRLPKGECLNSYYLKRLVEHAVGHYISNGAFIRAANGLGFEFSEDEGPNAFFHMELKLAEDDWKRVKPIGFSRWLFRQDDRLFAQDAKVDPNWPRQAGRFIDFWRYLKHHERAQDDLTKAWERWTGRLAPRPDLIDTDIVYDRECDFISYGERYPIAPEDSTYLYALVEVDQEHDEVRVKYVGQTQTPTKRLREHILRPGSIDRVKWMGELFQQGRYPQMAIFYAGAALADANELRRRQYTHSNPAKPDGTISWAASRH